MLETVSARMITGEREDGTAGQRSDEEWHGYL